MNVRAIMCRPPQSCRTETPVRLASRRMRDTGTGMLVVLDGHGKLVGIVTDRDLALALGEHGSRTSQLPVGTIMTRQPRTCGPGESVKDALARMATAKVRRLPVVNPDGELEGVVSIDDVILWGGGARGAGMHDVMQALRRILAARAARPEAELPAF